MSCGGGVPRGGGDWSIWQSQRGLWPPFLLLHIGAFSPLPPTGTVGLTPSPPSGSLTSSTSVPMRECHSSKGGSEGGNQLGGLILWSWVCSLLTAASWGLGRKCRFQPLFLWIPQKGAQPQPSSQGFLDLRSPRTSTPCSPSPSTHQLSWSPGKLSARLCFSISTADVFTTASSPTWWQVAWQHLKHRPCLLGGAPRGCSAPSRDQCCGFRIPLEHDGPSCVFLRPRIPVTLNMKMVMPSW